MGNGLDPLPEFLEIRPEAIISLKQIHSNRAVAHAKAETAFPLQEGDALISNTPGIILTIRTADCVPILFYDPREGVIAAVHAGWRGIESGIIEETLSRFASDYGSRPADVLAAIGPAICQRCFEIGPEVAEKFTATFGDRAPLARGKGDRFHLDLGACCRLALADSGVPDHQIESLDLCTACRPDLFYSYRRDGAGTGRLVAFIGIRSL